MHTKYIAHRGYSSLETENTYQSFIKAAKEPLFYGMECDVQITSDGHFVVHHDDSTGRLANENLVITKTLLGDLLKLKFKDKKTNEYSSEYKIVEFYEYLQICKEYNKLAVIELKCTFIPKKIEELISIINSYEYLDNCVFISFDLGNLIRLREINKKVKIQFLTSYFNETLLNVCKLLNFDFNLNQSTATKEIIELIHESNLKVNAWTVNDEEIKKKLSNYKIDFITTDLL